MTSDLDPPPRLAARWQRRRDAAIVDLSRRARHPEPDRLVSDPLGRRFVVRAVGADDDLDPPDHFITGLVNEAILLAMRAIYRGIRRRPQTTPGYVVGVIDCWSFVGGVVHSEPVSSEAQIAEKMTELVARVAAGEDLSKRSAG